MTPPVHEGYADFEGHPVWYQVVGDLAAAQSAAQSGAGPAPLVTLHGGPGATHDYLLSLADLADDGRAVIFYDQTGNGRSAHFPDRGAEYYTVARFAAELTSLVGQLGVADRYHVLGQSWGGMLAQEHAIARPPGLASVVLSNTAASFGGFAVEAGRLRTDLPPEVEATLRRHEAAGTTSNPEYAEACDVYYRRHVCRLEEWPAEVLRSFELIDTDPTVYHTTNGPSEFHVIGSFRDWSARGRLDRIEVPALVISGRHDEATPRLQDDLVAAINNAEQVILEESSHMPFWEQRADYMAAVGDFLRRHD
jgi:L-proline amide hydrolase